MKAHYLVFHPEKERQKIQVVATALVGNNIIRGWNGDIFVDRIGNKNEDPFVFNNPWLYSYCHATELRRKFTKNGNHIQVGSWIFFASGQFADRAVLTFDTVFLVGDISHWIHKPTLALPLKFQTLYSNPHHVWQRHLQFPFSGEHDSVTHTYEAQLWNMNSNDYSFLPYAAIGERVSFPISILSSALATKITGKVKGKRPVPINDVEVDELLKNINALTTIKVLSEIV